MAFWKVSVLLTMNGASGVVCGILDEEPMCMHTTVPVSSHAWKNGSHCLEWIDGRPNGYGFSLNATAYEPLAAHRWISSAHSNGSHNGTIVNGINFPFPSPAHHSSIIQSLYAFTHNNASSLSSRSMNVCPQNLGNEFGKQIDA